MDKEKESGKMGKYELIIKTPIVSIYQKIKGDKTLIINKKEITFQTKNKILKRKRPL